MVSRGSGDPVHSGRSGTHAHEAHDLLKIGGFVPSDHVTIMMLIVRLVPIGCYSDLGRVSNSIG